MYKYRITNTAARPIFLTEAGRLLQPGDAAPINRLDKGTSELVSAGELRVDEGSFPPYVAPKKPKAKERVSSFDDDEDDAPVKKAAPSTEKAALVIVDKKRSSKVVPLIAAGGEEPADEDVEVMSASTDEDDDLGIPSVTKADIAKGKLADIETPAPVVTAATSGFHDNLRVGKSKN